jgi:hypothetical protein
MKVTHRANFNRTESIASRRGRSTGGVATSPEWMVPVERIELPTFGLQNRCSTAELNRPTHFNHQSTPEKFRRHLPQIGVGWDRRAVE